MGTEWLDQFMELCTGCTIDCVNQHWYDSRGNDFKTFKDQIEGAYKYNVPVFVGEFAGIASDSNIDQFIGDVTTWMDGEPNIVGYAYFMVANGLMVNGDALSSTGEAFCHSA